MAHRFTFTVEVGLERETGKFASRDELAEQLMEALESADPSYVTGVGADGMSEYTTFDWSVVESTK